MGERVGRRPSAATRAQDRRTILVTIMFLLQDIAWVPRSRLSLSPRGTAVCHHMWQFKMALSCCSCLHTDIMRRRCLAGRW